MLIKYLQEILINEKQRGANQLYQRSALKEYLQVVVLNFIYTNAEYKDKLIFTGGTCLRHFYGLQRLSEDLDFDFVDNFNAEKFANDLEKYFVSKLQYQNLDISLKQKNRQVLLKFPVLRELGLATASESDLLYIKSDLSMAVGKHWSTQKTAKSAFGFNFVALHYDLSSLFAGKIAAILTRNLLTGKDNRQTIKGRDFFDLLWYLKQDVEIEAQQVRERLQDPSLTAEKIQQAVDEKVKLACTTYKTDFKNDLLPFISSAEFIEDYVENYWAEYERLKVKIQK
jgi:predicted nucleotidyltransferase component of viral defense system